jgi:hypothetical protein
MGRGAELVYNLITLFALVGVVAVLVVVGAIMAGPPPPLDIAGLPTAGIIPTATATVPTATFTPSRTSLPPTWTLTPTETFTFTPSPTVTASVTPTPTITDTPAATLTPSITPSPSISPTFTPTITATGPTPTLTPSDIPYPFNLRDPVNVTTNFANTAGCNWQGIGGIILDKDGNPYTKQLIVRGIYNNGTTPDITVPSGSSSAYGGASGFEIKFANRVESNVYYVRLETVNGTQVSPLVQVTFAGDCNANAGIVNFIQTR